MVNKVRIEIAGSRYVIATPEGEERVLSLGRRSMPRCASSWTATIG